MRSVGVAGFQALLIELSTPTTFVEIAGGWNSDYLELRAFDEHFNMLALPQTLTTDPRVAGYSTTRNRLHGLTYRKPEVRLRRID